MPVYRVITTGLSYPTNEAAVRRRKRGEDVPEEELEIKTAERGDVVDDLPPDSAKWLLEDGDIEVVPQGSRHRNLPEPEPVPDPLPAPPIPFSSDPLPDASRARMQRAGVFPAIEPGFEPGAQPLPEPDAEKGGDS